MEQEEKKIIDNNKGIGWGIAALVLGIISIVFLYYIIISIISAVLAIVFGIVGISRGDHSFARTGLILGIISLIVTFLLYLFLDVLDVSIFMVPKWYKF